jgi:hypothetical protein
MSYQVGDLVEVVKKSNWTGLPVGSLCLIIDYYYDGEGEKGYKVKHTEDEKGERILYQDEIEKIA